VAPRFTAAILFSVLALAAEGDCAHKESFSKLLKWNYFAYVGKRMHPV
jgi:hypothetical protein